jgi:cytidylate kinase
MLDRGAGGGLVIVAIDGPAAAGKGTISRGLARRFGLAHLDSGALYRAVALELLRRGASPTDQEAAVRAARALPCDGLAAILEDPELRAERTTEAASIVATIPEVREALLDFQRNFAHHPPNGAKGAAVDGRDIGTVVLPEADCKLFVTASLKVRAERRVKELRERGVKVIPSLVLADMRERDRRDRERGIAPLVAAGDAFRLDTTGLDAEAALEKAVSYIQSCKQSRPGHDA